MRNLKITLLALGMLLVPSLVQSQPPPPPPAPASAESKLEVKTDEDGNRWTVVDGVKKHLEETAEGQAAEETESTLPDLFQDGAKVYSDWKALGWMGGLLALVTFLMQLLNFGPIKELFKAKKITWLKPILAAVFGGVGAGVSTAMTGAGVGPSIVAGLVAGLAAVGLYEAFKRRKAENRTK